MKRLLIVAASVAVLVTLVTPQPASSLALYEFKPARTVAKVRSAGATLLQDGRLLTMGGHLDRPLTSENNAPQRAAQVFSPKRNTWSVVAPMDVVRRNPSAVTLGDGRVLVTQFGYPGYPAPGHTPNLNSYEIYNPTSNSWNASKQLPTIPGFEQSVSGLLRPLNDGGAVLLGDADKGSYTYDPVADSWTRLAVPWTATQPVLSASALANGQLLVVVYASGATYGTFTYDAVSDTWNQTTTPPFHRCDVSMKSALMHDGRLMFLCNAGDVYEFGPYTSRYVTSVWTFDPANAAWEQIGEPGVDIHDAAIAAMPDGTVAVIGGSPDYLDGTRLDGTVAAVFDPEARRWNVLGRTALQHLHEQAFSLPNGVISVGNASPLTEELVHVVTAGPTTPRLTMP